LISSTNIISLILAYLVGSIPSAVWIGRTFYDIDVREYGSGNAGATNTFRVLGFKAGIVVLLMDIAKGFVASYYIPKLLADYPLDEYINLQLACAIAALMGHIFPVYVGFRGGKGVATMLGILIGVHPAAAAVCAGVFLLMFLTTRYVSLSSMTAGITFPVVIMVFYSSNTNINLFSLAVAIMVLITHQRNIERLMSREESKVNLFRRKKEA
jgi:acyl phosphate:glycerol-3-phosphate acyltransferase